MLTPVSQNTTWSKNYKLEMLRGRCVCVCVHTKMYIFLLGKKKKAISLPLTEVLPKMSIFKYRRDFQVIWPYSMNCAKAI